MDDSDGLEVVGGRVLDPVTDPAKQRKPLKWRVDYERRPASVTEDDGEVETRGDH